MEKINGKPIADMTNREINAYFRSMRNSTLAHFGQYLTSMTAICLHTACAGDYGTSQTAPK